MGTSDSRIDVHVIGDVVGDYFVCIKPDLEAKQHSRKPVYDIPFSSDMEIVSLGGASLMARFIAPHVGSLRLSTMALGSHLLPPQNLKGHSLLANADTLSHRCRHNCAVCHQSNGFVARLA